MGLLSPEELKQLWPAETSAFPSPIPTQSVSSDEFMPAPQTAKQREFEARIKEYGSELARHQGMSRRAFFKTAAGMAAAFVAMNETYGRLYEVSRAEAAIPEMAGERAQGLSKQFIMDMHTHFLRDDTRIQTFLNQRKAVGQAGWNPALAQKEQTIDDLKFANYLKEIYFDSDTKVACVSGSPSEETRDWFLTNEMKAQARATINSIAGTKRSFCHAIFTPGYPGWMESIDHALADLKPDSMKGYTIGDNTNKNLSKHPWRLDDEKLVYPAYEKFLKAGLKNVCIHKGLFPPSVEKDSRTCSSTPTCATWARRRRTGRRSILSSTTAATALPAVGKPRMPGPNLNRPGASNGSPTSPRSRESSESGTSTRMSASCSRRPPSPSRVFPQ
jgi:uncharacterized protein